MSAPDRIWTTGRDDTGSWNASETRIGIPERVFLASTPAREHAEELAALVREIGEGDGYEHAGCFHPQITALLSKIYTGESNDRG